MITDRLRFSVIQMNTDEVLARDLVVMDPSVTVNLSAPGTIQFTMTQGEWKASSEGIDWKPWGQWVVCEVEIDYVQKVFAYGIVTDCQVDPESGMMQIQVTGPLGYPKGIPWLENFNPIAVDPFEIVQRVWAHVQNFSNANLGVNAIPASSGTQMLPGYGFDGDILSFDFFAIFNRAIDFNDAGDTITSLARDIPFDIFEEAEWNADRTELTRNVRMAYPLGGLDQVHLRFALGENVISAERAEPMNIEPVTDVIIRSWLPGRVYDARLSNADPTMARRILMEEDAYIDSTERAAAMAKRRLQKRNVPFHFQKIAVNPHHPNAPFGSFGVGDTIRVIAENYPWQGAVDQEHRITSMTYRESVGLMELGLKAEGAFNYDPIDYNPDFEEQPTEDPNRLSNGYFHQSLGGWKSLQGQWFRVSNVTYDTVYQPNAGSVRIDLDDNGEAFRSNRASVTPGEHIDLMCAVRWQEVESGPTDAFQLLAFTSLNAAPVGSFVVDEWVNPTGVHQFQLLQMLDWEVPEGINEVALQFNVTSGVDGGIAWWTYARVVPHV